jgi:hypothetical protein
MENGLGQYAPQIVAMLLGGLSSSLGTTWLLRKPRGRQMLLSMKGWGIALVVLVSVGLGGGAVFWMVTTMLDSIGGQLEMVSAGELLLFGLAIGLPMSAPGVVSTWIDARATDEKKRKRKDRVVTKDDRRAYAEKLARQLRELSDPGREVNVGIGGDGGTVLKFEGDLSAKEAERLTEALRADLKEVGFKRVEGGTSKNWWARV